MDIVYTEFILVCVDKIHTVILASNGKWIHFDKALVYTEFILV